MRNQLWAFAASIACVFSMGVAQAEKPTITVLAAISLRDAMTEVAADFEKRHEAKVDLVFGASGSLAAQIETGAPADVFISAASAQVDRLEKTKLIDSASRTAIAHNVLVLIVPADARGELRDFNGLRSADVKRIAIGEPKSVPAGMYAAQTLKHLKLDTAVAEKLVLGANVKQVLDYVARGEADAGLVYASDVQAAGDKVRIVANADASWHEPIVYPGAVVSGSKQPELAMAFLNLMTGESGQAALTKHGFVLPMPTTQPAR